MKDCSKLGSLSAIVERIEDEACAQVGSLRLLNVIKGKPLHKNTECEGLMYVDGKIKGKPVTIMCDTGATHNFITPKEAKRLGLKVMSEGRSLKAVNSPPKQFCGIAQGVELCLGRWSGKVDFSIVPINDYNVVLGLKFFRQVNAHPMPYYNSLCILENDASCMVPVKIKGNGQHLSALQVEKGVRKGGVTYLAMLKEVDPDEGDSQNLPPTNQNVLKENEGIVPLELSKRLPPKRRVDYRNKLEAGIYHRAKSWREQVEVTRSFIAKTTKRRKKYENRKKRPSEY